MWLRNIFTNLLDLCTGLPSKATFIKKHVVPARSDDKFYNARCGICWDDYDAENPRSKVSCGHIFCLDCIHAMVKSPTGELCPYCKKMLFRPGLVKLVGNLFMRGSANYHILVARMMNGFYRIEDRLMQQVLWLAIPLYCLYNGPAEIVFIFVSKFTDLGTRNSKMALRKAFHASMLLTTLVNHGAEAAPILLPVYLVFGLHCFLWTFFVLDFIIAFSLYILLWVSTGPLVVEVDRSTVRCLALITFLARELIVFWILVPGTFPVAVLFVWALLVAVVWW